jgi:predicted Rossmann fold flavoprotein
LGAGPANYVSKNEHFCKSALSRFPPAKFIEMVERHGIAYHEKKLGQQFCDHSAQDIVEMLRTECQWAGAELAMNTKIERIERLPESAAPLRFRVGISRGGASQSIECESLVIATGGLSIPKIGATGLGYEIATQFGLKLVERAPALDGFTFSESDAASFQALAGLSIEVVIRCRQKSFRENILFTHAGLSGPAALQASLHWYPGDQVIVDLLPEHDPFDLFLEKKRAGNRGQVKNLLGELLPARFAEKFCALHFASELPLPQVSEKALEQFCLMLKNWSFIPSGTVGYSKAEVTRGGVNTDELSSKTLEAKQVPGLHFIGEVVDVTGWLGGYNFQWAWASGWAAGQVV